MKKSTLQVDVKFLVLFDCPYIFSNCLMQCEIKWIEIRRDNGFFLGNPLLFYETNDLPGVSTVVANDQYN